MNPTGTAVRIDIEQEHLGVLRRSLEARVRDLHLRLGSDPGDEGFRREATLATELLRRVEALERRSGGRPWCLDNLETQPEDDGT
ncbi:hypothetical protein [Microvirga subterranea]|uniref:Uncharacterized protein n=1 Tax=Microvirga subterranea TaxID=186651 RepID=A0A370HL67_9HYPH|nr:hypothetical protein [Microvirga subterranea]RDI58801.1 hypothetical protein DES45_105326 [Microvirga subterranea]